MAFLIVSSYFSNTSSVCMFLGNSYSNKAIINDFCIVFSAAEMFRLPSIQRIKNFVSSSFDSSNRFYKMACLSPVELLPLSLLIVTILLKTFSMVRGTGCLKLLKKWLIVFWPFLHLYAASPKSPVSFIISLMMVVDDPQALATAFVRISLPIPS